MRMNSTVHKETGSGRDRKTGARKKESGMFQMLWLYAPAEFI